MNGIAHRLSFWYRMSTVNTDRSTESVMALVPETARELEVKQYERLVNMVKMKYERQKKALVDTELQLAGAEKALENAKKAK